MVCRHGLSILLLLVLTLGTKAPAIETSTSDRIASLQALESQKASEAAAWLHLDSSDAATVVRMDRVSSTVVGAPWETYDLPAPGILQPESVRIVRGPGTSGRRPLPGVVALLI